MASADILKQRKRINRKLTQAANANATAVLNLVAEELPLMNGVNMATALHRMARQCVKGEAGPDTAAPEAKKEVESHPAYSALLRALEQTAEAALLAEKDLAEEILPAQCASIIAWSLACLDVHNDRLMLVLASLAQPKLMEFKFYEVTNMLWAYAKLRAAGLAPDLIRAIQQRLVRRRSGEYKAHCLSLAVWAVAEIGWLDEVLMSSLADELAQQAETLQPQEICNLCWALSGKLRSQQLLEAVHTSLQGDALRRFKAEEFSNFMLAITAGHLSFPGLYAKVGATAVRLAKSMKPKHIASTLSAVACSGPGLPDLSPLLDVATEQITQFRPHELAACGKAAAKLHPEHPGFFKACATHLVLKLSELSVENLSDLIDAFTHCSDASASKWALYWLYQERAQRPHGQATRKDSTASTQPGEGDTLSSEVDVESSYQRAGRSSTRSEGDATPPERPFPDLGEPWKVLPMRAPPGLEGCQVCICDSNSYFTM